MATPIFPTALFGFLQKEFDVERQTLRGPTAISGAQDVSSTDGGGRVFAEFGGGSLIDRDKRLAWRAVLTGLEEGATEYIVPFCDRVHTPYGGEHRTTHSDGTPFDDLALYSGGGPSAVVLESAALRAVTLRISLTAARPLVGGEWFSILHATKNWRAYTIKTVADDGTIEFRPPLREAVDAGTPVELALPRCVMVQDGRASKRLDGSRLIEAAIRLVESP